MPEPVKPAALEPGCAVRIVAPASPVEEERLSRGCEELTRLGYTPHLGPRVLSREGYFAGATDHRLAELEAALADADSRAIVCARGGYGTNYLVERLRGKLLSGPKVVIGYSDVTSLQIFLWQEFGWVTFYGPMVANGFDAGPAGYDVDSFTRAVSETRAGWWLELCGEVLVGGAPDASREGLLLGGCLALVEATLGTPWELKTDGAILLLEDRGARPYQVDRMLMHLKQAGKFAGVRAIVLGEFPECDPPEPGGVSVRDVFWRVLGNLGVPVVCGVPFGHAARPMLTLPLGVPARLHAAGAPRLEILEPACVELGRAAVTPRLRPGTAG